jgi:hypothetical protein
MIIWRLPDEWRDKKVAEFEKTYFQGVKQIIKMKEEYNSLFGQTDHQLKNELMEFES